MININSLSINATSTAILASVSTSVGFTFTKILLWDNLTYRDYSKAIDLTSKLLQTSENEDFTIVLSDLTGISSLTGMLFIEFTTNEATSNTQTGLVANFVNYHECLMDKALAVTVKNCKIEQGQGNCSSQNNILFIGTLIDTLYTAVLFGLIDEAISIMETLNELCEVCTHCPDLGDAMLVSGLGFKTVNNQITPL